MGIPSFYKHLIQSIVGLTSKSRAAKPALFALDLNCAIYHCVKKTQQRFPYTPAEQKRWESALIESVIAYIKHMTALVEPTEHLYIAVDGVAPMAKIKQQRMRRFKSAVAADEEARIKAEASGVPVVSAPRWDTNAITPGTAFMGALATALRAYARTKPSHIHVSPADEPGEGEQKIMAWIREKSPRDAVVYGLDADLIVLSLLASATTPTQVDLFREETEFNGAVKTDVGDEEKFLYLNTDILGQSLYEKYAKSAAQPQTQFLTDFVALMNFLGNDFVPHGMSLKIRDDGVDRILSLYKSRITQPLLLSSSRYNPAALTELFSALKETEEGAMLRNIKKKLEARVGATAAKSPEERALAAHNDKPVEWAAEAPCVEYVRVEGAENKQMVLKPTWKAFYDAEALFRADPKKAARAYLDALAWTLAYYNGETVDMAWYYPWPLPPRYETLHAVITERSATELAPPPLSGTPPLKPQAQLAMVLPQTSFHLLPAEYAKLPTAHPHAWPTGWGLYSFGRRFLWECEPLIPLIQVKQIQTWVEELYD
jgi:5'-3' exonuclease